MAGLYFHIPFCRTICGYCDFYRSADLRHIGEVLEAMERELLLRRQFIGAEPVRTIYFGGRDTVAVPAGVVRTDFGTLP